jgi:hypothetical protein
MMHNDSVVVTIVNDDKKPLREHDFSKVNDRQKKCKVVLPFDSSYKILVKNQNDRRIKLEIEIDGTIVSGNGIVIDKNCTDYIERFINIDRKFKFVKPNSDGVSDPTNVENGLVKVRVVKEMDAPSPLIIKEHHYHHYDYWYPYGRRYLVDPWTVYGSSGEGLVGGCYPDNLNWTNGAIAKGTSLGGGATFGASMEKLNNMVSFESASLDANVVGSIQNADGSIKSDYGVPTAGAIGEVGATVEGAKSDQTFGSTNWIGDLGEASIFTFQLLGMNPVDNKEYEEYLKLKQKFEG